MVGSSKHQCRFKIDEDGNPITENGEKVLMCKVDGEGPITAHPKNNGKGYNFVPEGKISDKKEGTAIKYMKRRLGVEGKTGEW